MLRIFITKMSNELFLIKFSSNDLIIKLITNYYVYFYKTKY